MPDAPAQPESWEEDAQCEEIKRGALHARGSIDIYAANGKVAYNIPMKVTSYTKGSDADPLTWSCVVLVTPAGLGYVPYKLTLPTKMKGSGAVKSFRFHNTADDTEASQAAGQLRSAGLVPYDVDTWQPYMADDDKCARLEARLVRFFGLSEDVAGAQVTPVHEHKELAKRDRALAQIEFYVLFRHIVATTTTEVHVALRRLMDIKLMRLIELKVIADAQSKEEKGRATELANRLCALVLAEGDNLAEAYVKVFPPPGMASEKKDKK